MIDFLRKKPEYIYIFVVLIIVGGLLYYVLDTASNYKAYIEKYTPHHENYDSLFNENSRRFYRQIDTLATTKQRDSILTSLSANQIMISKRQEDLVNDIRQETNNNIDKLNILISFWVGILAIIGGVFPAIYQLKLAKDNRKKFEYLTKKNDEKINNQIAQIKKQKKQISENQKKIERQRLINELNSIYLSVQYRLVPENTQRDVYKRLWNQCIQNLENILRYFPNNSCEHRTQHPQQAQLTQLIDTLIHISATLRLIATSTSRNRHRAVTKANDDVICLMRRLSGGDYLNWAYIQNEFQRLIRTLRSLSFE